MNFIMIEDHNLVRQGVSKIIEEKSDFRCSGTFSSIDEAKVFLADYCRSTDYEPLICIVDINLGDKADDADGLSLISFIKENYPRLYSICYSMFKGAGIVILPRDENALTAEQLEETFRRLPVPIIGRIQNGCFELHMQTVFDEDLLLFIEEGKTCLSRENGFA